MRNPVITALGATILCTTATYAQNPTVDPQVFEAGQEIFEQTCAQCHQVDGSGRPPTFPALDGNEILENSEGLATIIHDGRGAMPAFSQLDSDDLTAVITYIRNAWNNEFGPVDADTVSGLLEGPVDGTEASVEAISSWTGVFTQEQAERGQVVYDSSCATCHGRRLDGAADDPDRQSGPPLARYAFLRDWDGRSLAAVFEYSRSLMPQENPGSLSDQQYVDIIAYMLSVSGMPEGDEELMPETGALSNIIIDQEMP